MLRLIFLGIFALSTSIMAQTDAANASSYKNLFEITGGGFGWEASKSKSEYTDTTTGAKEEYETTDRSFVVNYARKLAPQFWLQGLLNVKKTEVEYDDTTSTDLESKHAAISIRGIFDLDENPLNSFFIKGGFGVVSAESKNGTTKTETDFKNLVIGGGKRWSLAPIGIPNATYALALEYAAGSGEKKIAAVEEDIDVKGLTLSLMELDLFF